MDERNEDDLLAHHSAVAVRKMTSMQEEYMATMKNMVKYGLIWNKLGITMAENYLNAFLTGTARWSDAGMYYQRNLYEAFQPHETRKIDRMVHEILKGT